MFQELRTAHLILRELTAADAEPMFRYRSHPAVARYQGWHPASAEELRVFFAQLSQTNPGTAGEWYQIAIALRQTGELVGDCGIRCLEDRGSAEIGITIAPEYQRQGYAREALAALVDYLFQTLGMHRLTATVDPENVASMRLMQSLGWNQSSRDSWVEWSTSRP